MSDSRSRTQALLAKLFRRQTAVLLSLLLLALAGHQAFERALADFFDDGALINTAGRQRMLSQRIIAFAYQAAASKDDAERSEFRRLVDARAVEMGAAQARLIEETRRRGMSDELHRLYFEDGGLDAAVADFVGRARALAAAELDVAEPRLRALSQLSRETLLPGLEKVVARYQEESVSHASGLSRAVMAGLLAKVGILAFAWFGVFRPMARRLREELGAHEAAEEQNRLILGAVGEGIIGLDHAGRVIFVNEAAERMVGYGAGEMIGQRSHALIHHTHKNGAHYPAEDCPLTRTLRDGSHCQVDGEVFWRRDGSFFPVAYTSTPIEKPNGLRGAVITFRDVTDQLEAARALAASEEVKTSILDAALDAIITVDGDGRIVEFNPAAERMFGVAMEAARGREIADIIIPEEHREAHRRGLARVAGGGASRITGQRLEMTALHSSGRVMPVELAITHLPDHGLFTAFIRDLTEQKRTEAALQRSQKLEAVGRLTGGIAHDFNNLLGIISGNLELLQKSVGDDDKGQRRLGAAMTSARRGADLTRRLLAFSRQEQGGADKEVCDVREIISGMLDMLERTLTRRIEVSTMLDAGVWPVRISRSEFEDSLLNLVINARDAMPEGGILALEASNVSIGPEYHRIDPNLAAGDYVVVAVSDTGTGIPKDVLDRIFEPFFTTKERGKGTGLGLSMVYGFARRSGGHVRAYSEVGVGTTFRLYFPRVEEALPAGVVAAPPPPMPRARPGERVLVVDDEGHLAEIAGEFLADLGYETKVMADAGAALRLLEEGDDFDLLFTDVVMPHGLDGFALARRAEELGRRCKVVFTSGFTGYAHDRPGQPEISPRRLLLKPYGKADLARVVREALDEAPCDSPEESSP